MRIVARLKTAYLVPMLLEGSCHCGAVRFSCESRHPYPYQRCYCSICRKAGGGAGYLINISADAASLQVTGREQVKIFRAEVQRGGKAVSSKHQRHFCGACGCHLWAFHAKWPDLIYPVAGAIDTELPTPPTRVHMMTDSKASWVEVESSEDDVCFTGYPEESIAAWHAERNLEQ